MLSAREPGHEQYAVFFHYLQQRRRYAVLNGIYCFHWLLSLTLLSLLPLILGGLSKHFKDVYIVYLPRNQKRAPRELFISFFFPFLI